MRGKRVDLGAYEYNVRSGTLMFLRQNGTTAPAGSWSLPETLLCRERLLQNPLGHKPSGLHLGDFLLDFR